VLRLVLRRGLLDDYTVNDMLTWRAAGGFSLDTSVRYHGTDSTGRERLIRYCARPPFALERLRIQPEPAALPLRQRGDHAVPDAGRVRQVLDRPPRPTPDGRSLLVLSPLDFLAALARLIPPPRVHRHRYHGVLAPHARLRARAVAMADAHGDELQPSTTAPVPDSDQPPAPDPHRHPAARSRWARLLARIY